MITYEKSQKLMQLIENYTAAAVDASWKGTSPPDEAAALEHDLAHTKDQLVSFVLSITANRDTIHLPQNTRQARAMIAVADMFLRGETKNDDGTKVPADTVEAAKDAACTVPPAGWRCTRAAGHDGPCAAVPFTRCTRPPLGWQCVLASGHEGPCQIERVARRAAADGQ